MIIPLIDPHIHLGGSIPTKTVWELIQKHNLKHLAETHDDVVSAMQFIPGERYDFHKFLNKFSILDEIIWDIETIRKSIKDVCDWLQSHNIDYAWMRFSINKYMPYLGMHKFEVIKLIYDCFEEFRPNKVGLMLALKYESTKASQRQYARLIDNAEVVERLIGLDLVGDEGSFDHTFYKPIFDDWRKSGKILCAHVGESQEIINVIKAIEVLEVNQIAHGIKIIDDVGVMKEAKNRDICFDLAITSNRLTNVWNRNNHPIHPIRRMFDYGLKLTIGTDDPVQCNTDLPSEYKILSNMGFNKSELDQIKQNAADRAQMFCLISH